MAGGDWGQVLCSAKRQSRARVTMKGTATNPSGIYQIKLYLEYF